MSLSDGKISRVIEGEAEMVIAAFKLGLQNIHTEIERLQSLPDVDMVSAIRSALGGFITPERE